MKRGWAAIRRLNRRRGAGVLSGVGLACGLALLVVGTAQARTEVKPDKLLQEQLLAHIRILASDDFAGREPGTDGEAKSLRYIARQFYDIGLVSGTNQPANPWFAPVRIVSRRPAAGVAQFYRRGRSLPVSAEDVLVLTSGRRALIQGAPLLFVGRGLAVPPRSELAGRVAVILDRPPAGEQLGDTARQNALLAGGAAAVMTVLDGPRNLAMVSEKRSRSAYALASEALGGDVEAYVTPAALDQMLDGVPDTLASLQREADRPDFAPRLLDVSASLEATTRETVILTHNLVARLPGKNSDAGAVVLMAHWDHFGTCAAPPAPHLLCNGAVDNASGVAGMIEVARRVAKLQLDRDVYFVATTGEEWGLLGAEAFAENPPLPLQNIVAAFNLDSLAIAPAGTPLGIVGKGLTSLDTGIANVAREQHRKLDPGEGPNRYIRRQDGWALLAHDVPTVMVTSAYGDLARLERFFDGDYHRPGDVVKAGLELGGAVEDVAFHVALVQYFADNGRFQPYMSNVQR
ncbi:M28 family peptidase [Novosphingobium umbonatum]|uniref:M28 family peptidase n=1 Tax=Novosphingobium umbonatum TaxID=1908524 RepID=A0A437N3G8_9SPHN|nr:M28 family peptidase [Novosphingobium umbonatum]RVU04458.1 M28 family peptidase [Novosphingobium umbonatum]